MEKTQKPFILEIEEAKMELAEAINKAINGHNLPVYIVNMILTNFLNQTEMGARNELNRIKEQMAVASAPQQEDDKGTV